MARIEHIRKAREAADEALGLDWTGMAHARCPRPRSSPPRSMIANHADATKLHSSRGARGGTEPGIARVMAAQGARVALLDLDGAGVEKTAAELAVPGIALACDVAVESAATAAVGTVVKRLGGLDTREQRGRRTRPATRTPRIPPPAAGGWMTCRRRRGTNILQNLKTTFVTRRAAGRPKDPRGRGHREHRLDRGAGSVPDAAGLCGGESRRDLADQEPGRGLPAYDIR